MNPADPGPNLSPEEKAFAETLRGRVRVAAAPEDFARRLREGGPPPGTDKPILPMRRTRFYRFSSALAAAAAVAATVALAWIGFRPTDPETLRPRRGGEFTLSDADGRRGAPPTRSRSKLPEQAMAVHQVGVIRRDHGQPPIQLIAVEGIRVRRSGADSRVELETRLVPLVLRYH